MLSHQPPKQKRVCVCARVTVGDADHRALQHRPTFYMSTYIDTCSPMMMMLMMTIKRRNIFVFFGSPDAVCSIEKASHRVRPYFDERRDKLFPSLHQEQHSSFFESFESFGPIPKDMSVPSPAAKCTG